MISRRVLLKSLIGFGLGSGLLLLNKAELLSTLGLWPKPLSTSNLITGFENAPSFLITPTYDQSGQAMHPCVIDFKIDHSLESWCGFRYWMAYTPYPNFDSAKENPCLLVSNDGVTWMNHPQLVNPIVLRPIGPTNTNYNSDPELIYDEEQKLLLLYWREYFGNEYEKIWLKKFDSNLIESERILCLLKIKPWKSKYGLSMSPTIWRKNANQWYMWTTNGRGLIHLNTSKDGISWSTGQPCTTPWATWNGGYLPWHVAAKPNNKEQKIEFLICGWPRYSGFFKCQLFYAAAPMEQPSNLYMPLNQPILRMGTLEHWDNGFIYRSSFVIDQNETPQKYRIWYSACSKRRAWHIGYTEGKID